MPPRKGQPPVPTGDLDALSVEELMEKIQERRKQLPQADPNEVPEGAYPNFYWECIDNDHNGKNDHPIYRWVGRKGGLPTCPVCGSNRAYERGITDPSAPTP